LALIPRAYWEIAYLGNRNGSYACLKRMARRM
jgi:hypothetical protein